METVQLTTADGHRLGADVAGPAPGVDVRGGVVVCHPHPQYGGNRFNPVVEAVFTALPPAGFVAVRFDFRHVAGDGEIERLDVVAALDECADALAARSAGDRRLLIVGYSYGGMVALTTDDPRISACAVIAPPFGMMAVPPPPTRPTLLVAARHDQFCDPDELLDATYDWERAERTVVESADHFLAGRAAAVAEQVVPWLVDRTA